MDKPCFGIPAIAREDAGTRSTSSDREAKPSIHCPNTSIVVFQTKLYAVLVSYVYRCMYILIANELSGIQALLSVGKRFVQFDRDGCRDSTSLRRSWSSIVRRETAKRIA